MKNWKRGWWRWRMEGKGMSDRESLETLVAKYRSTRSQGWGEAAAAHAEALCAAVERLVAEPTHAQIADVRAGKAEGRIQALESALRWAITEIRYTRFSHYIADRLEASVLPYTDTAVRTQALEQMLRRLTDRELSVDGLYRMMGEARALAGAGLIDSSGSGVEGHAGRAGTQDTDGLEPVRTSQC